jgi:thiamine biosynthesis lipoprotein
MRGGLERGTFPAMGTVVTVVAMQEAFRPVLALVRETFATWERSLSRFDPDSELMRLNRDAGHPRAVSGLLLEVVEAALAAAAATEGVFDPTLLPALEALGYDRTFAELPQALPMPSRPPQPGGRWREIVVDRQARTVTLPPGVAVEFGGIAKGMAVDAAIQRLVREGLAPALVNAGGDLAVAGEPPGRDSWLVAVEAWPGFAIPLARGAIATSSVARRSWWQGGERRHHLLDPRTGLPSASGLETVTVAAGTCREAEVAAKVALLSGVEAGRVFLARIGLAGLFLDRHGRWSRAGDMVVRRWAG